MCVIDQGALRCPYRSEIQQAAISQKEIAFHFRKDIQSEKGWGLMSCA